MTQNKLVKNNRIIDELKTQMGALIAVCKEDYLSEEALKVKEELIEAIKEDDMLENINISCISNLDSFMFRCWLFEYKGRHFVLSDESNGHYGFLCSAEEALERLHYKCPKCTTN